MESVPNEESRITLDPVQVDPIFGQPAVHLDWQLCDTDRRTLIKALDLLKNHLQGATHFQSNWDSARDQWPEKMGPGDHHMGALRMSAAPEDGIVDPDCRVHSVENLYIAGSAVFPTSGYANPTLTIIALALRLADHLNGNSPSA